MALWPPVIDRINMSQGYVSLLGCRLLSGPKQLPLPYGLFFEKLSDSLLLLGPLF